MKILRYSVCILLAAAVAFSFTYGLKNINYSDNKLTDNGNYKCIISLWHIDTFEGGVGSRAEFLLSRAAAFEKKNKGVFVMVTAHTAESAAARYAEGERPDLISYGYGADPQGLLPIKTKKTFSYGEYDGKCYAVPWCKGAYVLLCNKEAPSDKKLSNVVVSQGDFTQPFAAAAFSGYVLENPKVKRPADAYYDFITGAADYLIGTQRDVNRINSRGAEVAVVPLAEYDDLYQYISVTSVNTDKLGYAYDFADYLLSDDVQQQLYKIGMLSEYSAVNYPYEDLNALKGLKSAAGLSVFIAPAVYKEFGEYAAKAAAGDAEAFKFLKNLAA